MFKLVLFIVFVADIILIASSTAVATATATGYGAATATANSGDTTATATATTSTGQCGPNQRYETCPDLCVPQTCYQLGVPCPPIRTPDGSCPTKPACVCTKNYVKNDKGVCIPRHLCPSCGGDENAESGCGNCPKTCKNYNSTEPIICPQYCDVNGCNCKKGYVLDENERRCVRPKDCTLICGPDEHYDSCANGGCHDARTCKELDTLNGTYICVDPIKCIPGCLCNKGLLRNKYGKCVPENKCPNSKCKGDHETYVECDVKCIPGTCDELGFPLPCDIPLNGTSCPGKPACICRIGYVKDKTGKCVPVAQCPSCGGDPNAKAGCGGYCGNRCSDYKKGPVACPLICRMNACDCKEGHVYDDNLKICVPPEKCTQTCGQNEQYTACVEGGCVRSVWNCAQIKPGQEVPIICKKPIKCTPGCLCKDDFYRNSNGVCVSKDDCKYNGKCLGRSNEFYDTCPLMCSSETCDGIGKPVDCPPQATVCKPACRCAQGYYRNYKGVCVKESQCKQCGKNEIYDKCVTACPPRKCGTNDAAVLCAPTNPADCKAGCRCADGFSRNDNGECVKPEDCPKRCKGANESWDSCVDPCDPNTCESIGKPHNCPIKPTSDIKCKGACRCNPGFYRNINGQCVSKKNCLKCTGPNEYYACGGACDNKCSTLSQQNQTNCPIINIKCNEMCYCRKGFARNRDNICVPISSCRRCPGKNSWYDTCPPICPPSDDCNTYKKTYGCPGIIIGDTSHCKPACRCEDNYLRLNGTCIPEEQCPCNGDPNAKPGCGCSRTCADFILNKPPTCTKICKTNACDCKKGYVLNQKSGKCVLPKDCPVTSATCPKGQTLGCGNNCNRKCYNYRYGTSPYTCPRLDCTEIGYSCQCDTSQGYYYNDEKQQCVPFWECPY